MDRDELVGTLELMRHVFSGMESTGELAAKHKPSETISKAIALLTSDATRIAELRKAIRSIELAADGTKSGTDPAKALARIKATARKALEDAS